MNRFTIYCTPEQTKKVIELGAPIKIVCPYTKINTKFDERVVVLSHSIVDNTNRTTYTLAETPTAEQIICWLEEQKIFVHIAPCVDICCNWHIASKGYNKYGYTSDIKVCKTRKEATLAAIDAALDYLIKNKK